MLKFIYIVLSFGLAAIAVAKITEQNVNPDINRPYQQAAFEDWLDIFEREGREVYDRRHEVVQALKLKPGMDIADIGAGTGFYSLLFAEKVGEAGNVFAVDVTEDFILNITLRAAEKRLSNVHGVLSTQTDTLLAPNSIDMAFVCDTYHHFEYPQTMLASIYRALRPGGQLVVIDYRKQPGVSSSWVMSHVRANMGAVIAEIERAGFRLETRLDILEINYFLRFVKVAD